MRLRTISITILFSLFILSSCGKKLPPTSPDRWAPRVLNVNAIDKHHLCIYFSEKIDTTSARRLEHFMIFNPENSETTAVIFSERDKKGDEVLLTIPELKDSKYSLLIFNIKDLKGNVMKEAIKTFKPSMEKDTIPPLLKHSKPLRIRTSAQKDSIILLMFTEPMDSGACEIGDFISTFIDIDSLFVWNKTLTEVSLRYKLKEGKICKLFVLPLITDLSGNPLGELRILTLTTCDTIPKNRMNVKIIKDGKELTKTHAFLSGAKKGLLQDITAVDTSCTFSFFFAQPDTYQISVISENPLDSSGIWWGESRIEFFPDTTRSMETEVEVNLVKKVEIPESLLNLYKILVKNIKSKNIGLK